MTVEEENDDLGSDVALSPVVAKRKRAGGKILKRLQRTKQPVETRVSTVSAVPGTVKKLAVKRAKPTSKFARKKYVCPHCNRRFLTRGNVKNHLRIHNRDKPFQCPVCQVSLRNLYVLLSNFHYPFDPRICLLTKVYINVI